MYRFVAPRCDDDMEWLTAFGEVDLTILQLPP